MNPVAGLAVAVRPGRETMILEELQILLLTGSIRVGDLAAELRNAGFPTTDDVDALVANAADALHEAGLAILDHRPSAAPPSPPTSFVRRRRARHVPYAAHAVHPARTVPLPRPPSPAQERALESACARRDVPNGVMGLSGGWLSFLDDGVRLVPESAEADVPDTATWHAPLWITVDGTRIVLPPVAVAGGGAGVGRGGPDASADLGTWRIEPLVSVDVAAPSSAPAELAAVAIDALGASGSRSLVALIVTMVEAGVVRHRTPRTLVAAGLPTPTLVAALAAVGSVEPQARSLKVAQGRVDPGRATWDVRLDAPDEPTWRGAARQALEAFGLPADVATWITAPDGHPGRLIVGVEPGSCEVDARTKVYVHVEDVETWHALRGSWPVLDTLQSEPVLFDHVPPEPPRFVAWKRRGRTFDLTLSVYRRIEIDTISVSDALDRVLVGFPDWADAIRSLLAHDRDPGDLLTEDDLEVVESDGRRSIDLGVTEPSPRGCRITAARTLLEVAGLSDADAETTALTLARRPISRIITGTDASSRPFFSVYTT